MKTIHNLNNLNNLNKLKKIYQIGGDNLDDLLKKFKLIIPQTLKNNKSINNLNELKIIITSILNNSIEIINKREKTIEQYEKDKRELSNNIDNIVLILQDIYKPQAGGFNDISYRDYKLNSLAKNIIKADTIINTLIGGMISSSGEDSSGEDSSGEDSSVKKSLESSVKETSVKASLISLIDPIKSNIEFELFGKNHKIKKMVFLPGMKLFYDVNEQVYKHKYSNNEKIYYGIPILEYSTNNMIISYNPKNKTFRNINLISKMVDHIFSNNDVVILETMLKTQQIKNYKAELLNSKFDMQEFNKMNDNFFKLKDDVNNLVGNISLLLKEKIETNKQINKFQINIKELESKINEAEPIDSN